MAGRSMLGFGREGLAILVAGLMPGCNSSLNSPAPGDPAPPGITIVPPLTAEAASNHVACVERLRHLPKKAGFEARTFAGPDGAQMRYFLFRPRNQQTNEACPLILSLHGGAPRRKFEDLLEPYLPGLAYGLGRLVSDETQKLHPAFVVAPWSNNQGWEKGNLDLVMRLLASVQQEFQIDPKRRYVTGQSMGGFGTWTILNLYPDYFAAAIPICGGGDPSHVPKSWRTPLWAFHGTADHVVPVHYTRQMISAVRRAGGTPIYSEYQQTDHAGTAERAYCEPDLMSWLFAQAKP